MAKTILVVDDDLDIVEQVSYIVASLGHQVTTAFNRQEAEAKLCSIVPDLAIIDMMMEDRHSGCLLCRHIKRLFPDTAVIIFNLPCRAGWKGYFSGSGPCPLNEAVRRLHQQTGASQPIEE
jgi:response regulator RpfG family c-di-GMP phosphodiesterase